MRALGSPLDRPLHVLWHSCRGRIDPTVPDRVWSGWAMSVWRGMRASKLAVIGRLGDR